MMASKTFNHYKTMLTFMITGTTGARPDILMDSATPPPAFSEAIAAGARPRTHTSPSPLPNIRGSDSDLPRLVYKWL